MRGGYPGTVITYSVTTSSAIRSKKCPGLTRPCSPCSMMRKNGSRAANSCRFAMGLFIVAFLTFVGVELFPRMGCVGGEVGEADRRPPGDSQHIVVGLRSVAAGDRGCQQAQHHRVIVRHAGGDH